MADLEPHKGSEQGGLRPVLVLQNNLGNSYSPTTIIAPISNKPGKDYLPVHIRLSKYDCLDDTSTVLLEQIRVIDKSRLQDYVCSLRKYEMRTIDTALLISIGVSQIPSKEEDLNEYS